eukprot:3340832-Rhodomonas_salina.4
MGFVVCAKIVVVRMGRTVPARAARPARAIVELPESPPSPNNWYQRRTNRQYRASGSTCVG